MKKISPILLLGMLLLAVVPLVSAASKLQVQLTAFNITQNQDATTVKNHPGDVVRYTASVKNQGPDDLVDYEMKVYIKDVLKYASIIDLGGGVIEGDYIKFPPIMQAFSCNCTNSNYFKVKLKDTVCDVASLSAKYEDVTTTIPIECTPPPAPPVVPTKTGPELYVLALIAFVLAGGFVTVVAKRHQK